MNPIQIGRKRLSEIVWGILDERVGDYPYEIIEKIVEEQQSLRSKAEYNTGSVPYDDAVELYKIVRFFQPAVIAEVGTFIGVSTRVMNLASNGMVVIYTCDMSNAIDLDTPNIHQYPKTASTDMFKALADKDWKVDLVYLDGRLGQDDIEPLNKIIHDKTVFVLDDFEGTEKGVVNALMLESPNRVLIYPREDRKTAISLPFTMLQVVQQEMT
jgi:predicted O-methyltransferase YrrM